MLRMPRKAALDDVSLITWPGRGFHAGVDIR